MILNSVVVPIGKLIIINSVAVSPMVWVTVLVPSTFLDTRGDRVVTVAVEVAIILLTAPAGCDGSPVLLPSDVPGFPGVALLVPWSPGTVVPVALTVLFKVELKVTSGFTVAL